jgi:hypothetical protein
MSSVSFPKPLLCRSCERRDPYSVPYRSAAEYGPRLFGRDDVGICGTRSATIAPPYPRYTGSGCEKKLSSR